MHVNLHLCLLGGIALVLSTHAAHIHRMKAYASFHGCHESMSKDRETSEGLASCVDPASSCSHWSSNSRRSAVWYSGDCIDALTHKAVPFLMPSLVDRYELKVRKHNSACKTSFEVEKQPFLDVNKDSLTK